MTSREMLAVLGLENLLDGGGFGGAGRGGGARAPCGRPPARPRDYAEADRLRDEIRALGWEVRDGPGGAEVLPLQ